MKIRKLPINMLRVNSANDRHGELENETAAIAWLFRTRESHMKNLARDIALKGEVFDLPLVSPEGDEFIVFDGNRRVTCLKLIQDPKRAPTSALQDFFKELRGTWNGEFTGAVDCQVELNRERIDEVLFRRHTGTQNGVGQLTWDDRMKTTFVERTGKGTGINVADEIETRLKDAGLLPTRRKIPRSILNRLLSAEQFRNRLGFTIQKGRFKYLADEKETLVAMSRVATDLVERNIVLGDVWDSGAKTRYLDELSNEQVLPRAKAEHDKSSSSRRHGGGKKALPTIRLTLISSKREYDVIWPNRLSRLHNIWEELQFKLELKKHPNAISVMLRLLIELSVENYIQQKKLVVHENDKFSNKLLKVGQHMFEGNAIDQKYLGVVKKFNSSENILSVDTLNRYVHSQSFAPSPEHLTAIWDSLSDFVVICIKA